MENPVKMGCFLGGPPLFLETSIFLSCMINFLKMIFLTRGPLQEFHDSFSWPDQLASREKWGNTLFQPTCKHPQTAPGLDSSTTLGLGKAWGSANATQDVGVSNTGFCCSSVSICPGCAPNQSSQRLRSGSRYWWSSGMKQEKFCFQRWNFHINETKISVEFSVTAASCRTAKALLW